MSGEDLAPDERLADIARIEEAIKHHLDEFASATGDDDALDRLEAMLRSIRPLRDRMSEHWAAIEAANHPAIVGHAWVEVNRLSESLDRLAELAASDGGVFKYVAQASNAIQERTRYRDLLLAHGVEERSIPLVAGDPMPELSLARLRESYPPDSISRCKYCSRPTVDCGSLSSGMRVVMHVRPDGTPGLRGCRAASRLYRYYDEDWGWGPYGDGRDPSIDEKRRAVAITPPPYE